MATGLNVFIEPAHTYGGLSNVDITSFRMYRFQCVYIYICINLEVPLTFPLHMEVPRGSYVLT